MRKQAQGGCVTCPMSHRQFSRITRVCLRPEPLTSSWWGCFLCSASLLPKALAVFLVSAMAPLEFPLYLPAFPSLHIQLFLALHSRVLVCLIPTLQIPFPARSGKFCPQFPECLSPATPTAYPSLSSTQERVLIFPLSPPAHSNLKRETCTAHFLTSRTQA